MVDRYPVPPVRPSEAESATCRSPLALSAEQKTLIAEAVKAASALVALCEHEDKHGYPVDGTPKQKENYFIGVALTRDGVRAVECLRTALAPFAVELPNWWEKR